MSATFWSFKQSSSAFTNNKGGVWITSWRERGVWRRQLWTWGRHFQLVCSLQAANCFSYSLFASLTDYFLSLWEYADYSFGFFSEVMDTHSWFQQSEQTQQQRKVTQTSKLRMLSVSEFQLVFSPTRYLSGLYFSVLAASSVELVNSHSLVAERQAAGQRASVQVHVVQSRAAHVEVFDGVRRLWWIAPLTTVS